MASNNVFNKDPDAVLDYVIDWASWLAVDETISSVTITVPTGITKNSNTNTTTAVTVWLSGGTEGTTYKVDCKIVTSSARTDERDIYIMVVER